VEPSPPRLPRQQIFECFLWLQFLHSAETFHATDEDYLSKLGVSCFLEDRRAHHLAYVGEVPLTADFHHLLRCRCHDRALSDVDDIDMESDSDVSDDGDEDEENEENEIGEQMLVDKSTDGANGDHDTHAASDWLRLAAQGKDRPR